MKKIILTLLFVIGSTVAIYSQLNPVNNIEFYHEHVWPGSTCPSFNCFELSWEPPDSSLMDTLVGYKIYRNNQLYRFQDYIGVFCLDGPPPPCPDADFLSWEPFWMKVTAVYNSTSEESIANDSILFLGILTDLTTINNQEIEIQNNPIKKGEYISINLSSQLKPHVEIKLINSDGTEVQNLEFKQSSEMINISSKDLKNGIYIIVLKMENKIITEKIIIL